ncbi:hypothetical protein CEUSTIGMA_g4812.t1 [Chlamydomonas eustigma]|uniref:Hikeshi-like C-terminal domain-containing protein n=1 Tax=Chlamydomonas eustigma TaxID=1157962 RepID=A0A250X2T4_9CHLO|nr:hypothetical protein CEUSTIGMA_g4812.t1 [Chlamydomonas eustigma]|eukprot:GAX77366.1 hypothetical protein CEUSTIGMA_g4812.t1 [Chlamydomonas eustigma]
MISAGHNSPPFFGCFFVGHSYPVYSNIGFQQVDNTHWPNSLDQVSALGLYIKVGCSDWQYRGCVHNGHPTEVMPLQWPVSESNTPAPSPGLVQIGVSIEPGAEIIKKEGSKLGAREDFAKRVGMDLFRFMESFQTQQMGDHIVVPANVLDRWFIKFTDKFRRDPDFLTRSQQPV